MYFQPWILPLYYRFLANRQTQLARGVQEQALEEIKRHLCDFIGMHTWEELCREWLLRASANGTFPEWMDQIGSLGTSAAQVAVVGLNSMAKVLVLGECKWRTQPMGRTVLTDLLAKPPR